MTTVESDNQVYFVLFSNNNKHLKYMSSSLISTTTKPKSDQVYKRRHVPLVTRPRCRGPPKGAVHFARMPSQPKFFLVFIFFFLFFPFMAEFHGDRHIVFQLKIKRRREKINILFQENQNLKKRQENFKNSPLHFKNGKTTQKK